jgi:transcriptional regulator with XRE-family HTH domain
MPKPSPFGQRLAERRTLRGLTQQQLAELANIPTTVISHFETGVRASASADNLVKLADALDVSVDYLLTRTNDPTPHTGKIDPLLDDLSASEIGVIETLAKALARRRRDPESGG